MTFNIQVPNSVVQSSNCGHLIIPNKKAMTCNSGWHVFVVGMLAGGVGLDSQFNADSCQIYIQINNTVLKACPSGRICIMYQVN